MTETAQQPQQASIHPGYDQLGMILSRFGVAYDVRDSIAITGREDALNMSDMLYLAREHYGLTAKRLVGVNWQKIVKLPLPLIVEWQEGEFRVVIEANEDSFVVHDGSSSNTIDAKAFAEGFQGSVLLIGANKADSWSQLDPSSGFNFSLWSVVSFLTSRKGPFVSVMTAALFIQLFALVTPLFTMIIIDKVFSASGLSTLHVLIIGLFAIAIFDLLLTACRKAVLGHMTNKIDVILQAKLFRHLTHLPLAYFGGKMTGDVVSRVKEMETVRNFVTGQGLTLIIDMPFSLVFLIVMWLFNPLLSLIVVFAVILLVVLYGLLGPAMKKHVQQKNNHQTDNQSFLVEMISSMETIKSAAIEKQVQRRWEDHVARHARSSSSVEAVSGYIGQASGFVSKGTVALTLWVGAIAVLDGTMTPGQLIAFNMLVGRVIAPVQRMTQLMQQYQQIKVALKRVAEIFSTSLEPAFKSRKSSMPAMSGAVRFENVSFRYGNDLPCVLEEVNFDIQPGEVVGIVGSSGSGKTSLLRLLLRLYIPEKGQVTVDGFDISQVDPVWLRSNIGVVQQDNVLLNLSVRDNIAIAAPGTPMQRVEAAAALAGADEFIRQLPDGYDTVVGERGFSLSTGQRQRVSIARALVTNPKILVLDEATSMLDYEAEMLLQQHMVNIVKGRTVFIVAHRLPSLRHASRIISIEGGRIQENGSPQSLIEHGGRFAQLYEIQQKSFDFVRGITS